MNLNQKETGLVSDLKGQEEICIEKYSKYAEEAGDSQLKELFRGIASVERQHLSTLNSIEKGQNPSPSGSGSGSGSGSSLPQSFTKAPASADCEKDRFLCSDLLSTEKHASHLILNEVMRACTMG